MRSWLPEIEILKKSKVRNCIKKVETKRIYSQFLNTFILNFVVFWWPDFRGSLTRTGMVLNKVIANVSRMVSVLFFFRHRSPQDGSCLNESVWTQTILRIVFCSISVEEFDPAVCLAHLKLCWIQIKIYSEFNYVARNLRPRLCCFLLNLPYLINWWINK